DFHLFLTHYPIPALFLNRLHLRSGSTSQDRLTQTPGGAPIGIRSTACRLGPSSPAPLYPQAFHRHPPPTPLFRLPPLDNVCDPIRRMLPSWGIKLASGSIS